MSISGFSGVIVWVRGVGKELLLETKIPASNCQKAKVINDAFIIQEHLGWSRWMCFAMTWQFTVTTDKSKINMVELETSGWMVVLETIELYQNCWVLSTMEEERESLLCSENDDSAAADHWGTFEVHVQHE